jgi:hypothetical protein
VKKEENYAKSANRLHKGVRRVLRPSDAMGSVRREYGHHGGRSHNVEVA